jgi:hypothetical protein
MATSVVQLAAKRALPNWRKERGLDWTLGEELELILRHNIGLTSFTHDLAHYFCSESFKEALPRTFQAQAVDKWEAKEDIRMEFVSTGELLLEQFQASPPNLKILHPRQIFPAAQYATLPTESARKGLDTDMICAIERVVRNRLYNKTASMTSRDLEQVWGMLIERTSETPGEAGSALACMIFQACMLHMPAAEYHFKGRRVESRNKIAAPLLEPNLYQELMQVGQELFGDLTARAVGEVQRVSWFVYVSGESSSLDLCTQRMVDHMAKLRSKGPQTLDAQKVTFMLYAIFRVCNKWLESDRTRKVPVFSNAAAEFYQSMVTLEVPQMNLKMYAETIEACAEDGCSHHVLMLQKLWADVQTYRQLGFAETTFVFK